MKSTKLLFALLPLMSVTPTVFAHQADTTTLLQVEDQVITQSEVDATLDRALHKPLMKIYQAEKELYQLRREALYPMMLDLVLENEAKRLDMTKEEIKKREIIDKTPAVTVIEVLSSVLKYAREMGRLASSLEEEELIQIKEQLQEERYKARTLQWLQELHPRYKNAFTLKAPVYPDAAREKFKRDYLLTHGPDDAPIQVVAMQDITCDYCPDIMPDLIQLMETYPGKIKFIHHYYPAAEYHATQEIAEALYCAQDQAKFWDYLVQTPNLEEYSVEAYSTLAASIGMEKTQFAQCIESDKYINQVLEDAEEAENLDVGYSGTPLVYINGRVITDCLHLDKYKEIVEEELAYLE